MLSLRNPLRSIRASSEGASALAKTDLEREALPSLLEGRISLGEGART